MGICQNCTQDYILCRNVCVDNKSNDPYPSVNHISTKINNKQIINQIYGTRPSSPNTKVTLTQNANYNQSFIKNNNSSNKLSLNRQTADTIKRTISFKTDFCQIMLSEINLARTDPGKYAQKIKQNIPMIQTSTTSHTSFLVYDEEIKVKLEKGIPAFKSCFDYLIEIEKNIDNGVEECLPPLTLVDDWCIPFPDDLNQVCDKDYIYSCWEKIGNEVGEEYEIIDFQHDVSPNPVLSTIVQIVDDTNVNLKRRRNILNKEAKYIGISYGEIKKGITCFYLLFAK